MSHQLTSVPDADLTPLDWLSQPIFNDHYECVDEGMGFKNTSDYLDSTAIGKEDELGFPSDAPSTMQIVTEIWIDFYIQGTNYTEEPGIKITLYAGAVQKAQSIWNANTGGAWQVRRHKFTGLSLTKTEYNALDVRFEHVSGAGQPNPIVL